VKLTNAPDFERSKQDVRMKKQENQNKTLEASFEELQEIIKKLEKDDISLEDSFSLYTEGIELLKYCNNSIDKVEKQLIVLGENKESDELS